MPKHDPRDNQILDALPADERDRLFPHMELVEMPLGMVLYLSPVINCAISIFRSNSIVSLLYVLNNGASAEIAVVGNEGAVGVSLFMEVNPRPIVLFVQSKGCGLSSQQTAAQGRVRPSR